MPIVSYEDGKDIPPLNPPIMNELKIENRFVGCILIRKREEDLSSISLFLKIWSIIKILVFILCCAFLLLQFSYYLIYIIQSHYMKIESIFILHKCNYTS